MWLCAKPLALGREMPACRECPYKMRLDSVRSYAAAADAVSLCVLAQVSESLGLLDVTIERKTPWRASVHLHLSDALTRRLYSNVERALLHHVFTWALGPESERHPAVAASGPPLRLTCPLHFAWVPALARRVLAREATPCSLQPPWIELAGRAPGCHAHVQLGRVRLGRVGDRRGSLLLAPRGSGKTFVALSVLASNVMRTVVVVRNASHVSYWRALIDRWLPLSVRSCTRVVLPHERVRTMPERVVVDECVSRNTSRFRHVPHVLVLGTTVTHIPIGLVDAPCTSCFTPMIVSCSGGMRHPDPNADHPHHTIHMDVPDAFRRLLLRASPASRDRILKEPSPSQARLLLGPAKGTIDLCRTGSCSWPCTLCYDDESGPIVHCAKCCHAMCLTCRHSLCEDRCPFCRVSPLTVKTCPRHVASCAAQQEDSLREQLTQLQRFVIESRVMAAMQMLEANGEAIVVTQDGTLLDALPRLPALHVTPAAQLERGVYPLADINAAVFFAEPPSTAEQRCKYEEFARNRTGYVFELSV